MKHLWLMILLAMTVPAFAGSKTVRDWTATCDEYACSAEVTGSNGLASGGQGYRLQVARAGGKGQSWYLKLIAHNVPQPDGKMAVSIDGTETEMTVAPSGDGDGIDPTDQAAMEKVFPALRKGKSMDVSFMSKQGPNSETFSLSGLAAVLLWMDERQGRVGDSAGVAVVDGTLGAATITGDAQQALKVELKDLRVGRECQWDDEEQMPFNAQTYDLGEGYSLLLVQCTLGAYQPSTLVFLRGSDGLELKAFANYGSDTGWGGTNYLGFADFDPKTKALHNYVKFRGLGDCGASANWVWTGYDFKLTEYRYRDCSDDEPVNPDDEIPEFPVIYPAK